MKKIARFLRGFSLIELMITLLIIAVVVAFVVPDNKIFLFGAEDKVSSLQIMRAISLARSEAQLRGQVVTLCKSVDRVTCSGQWQDGFIAFVDEREDGVVANKENVVAVFNRVSRDGVLHWRSSLNRDYLQILPSGLTRGENGTFWFCPSKSNLSAWAVVVNQLGRARVVYPDRFGKMGSLHCDG